VFELSGTTLIQLLRVTASDRRNNKKEKTGVKARDEEV
jgi:hypothetical protein